MSNWFVSAVVVIAVVDSMPVIRVVVVCRVKVGTLMSVGMLLFCGSCYYHALTGSTAVRRVTPYGGMMLIAAWVSVML